MHREFRTKPEITIIKADKSNVFIIMDSDYYMRGKFRKS